jgi:hypothetical protein
MLMGGEVEGGRRRRVEGGGRGANKNMTIMVLQSLFFSSRFHRTGLTGRHSHRRCKTLENNIIYNLYMANKTRQHSLNLGKQI